MSHTAIAAASPQTKHGPVEDALGLIVGTVLASFGLFLLRSSETVTGGTAGLALLLSYAAPVPFGVLFTLVNLPFLLLAVPKKGWRFTLRTLLAIVMVSAFAQVHTAMIGHLTLPMAYAMVLGNICAGVGVLIVFRHGSSLGGFGIVALILQERRGIPAGYAQMALDLVVVLAALAVVPVGNVALSAVGAVILNSIIAFNHKPGRYTGW